LRGEGRERRMAGTAEMRWGMGEGGADADADAGRESGKDEETRVGN